MPRLQNKFNSVLETPINSNPNLPSAWNASTNRTSLHPLTSSPLTMSIPPLRLSLDDSLEMQDICDRFRNGVTINTEKTGVAKWKEDHMATTVKQLERLSSSVMQKDRLGLGDWFTENPTLISLAKFYSLLEPSEITAACVADRTALRYHRLLAKKKLLESLQSQTMELKAGRRNVRSTTMDLRLQIQATKDTLQKFEDEIIGTDTKEMKMLSNAIQVEIDAETDQYTRIEVMETVCSETKIDQAVTEIKSLHQRAETLSEELEYSKLLPPNIRQVKILVEERKQYLQQINYKVEDLVEYQYKRQC